MKRFAGWVDVVVIVALIIALLSFGGCASNQKTNFERCVITVAGESVIATQRMSAANWCANKVGMP
jgi:uncharacterized protein YycO